MDTLGGPQDLNVVNEFGLYRLILRSDKAKAKAFQRWVIHEVLPAIRKTGRYEARRQNGPQIDESDVGHAHRRFQQIYTSDFVDPDTLLKLLFGGNIPFSGDNKFRFLAVPACEALGLQNPTAAIRLLPDSEQDSVVIYTPQGPRKMAAITEAGLYFLAFSPRAKGGAGLNLEFNFLLLCNAVHFIESAWREFRRGESSRPVPFDTSSGASLEHSIVHASDIASLIQHVGIRTQNRSGRVQEA
jgi:prophage antirepressor-like protein